MVGDRRPGCPHARLGEGRFAEPRHAALAQVAVFEVRRRGERARQESAAQRAVGDDPDAQLPADGRNVTLQDGTVGVE